jgi:hypothetical protein
VGRSAPKVRAGGHLMLRDMLERELVEQQEVVARTISRILASPRLLPTLLLVYGKCNWEIQPPQTVIVERERVQRLDEQARVWRERDALREAQWAAEDAAELADEASEPEAESVPAPVPAPPPVAPPVPRPRPTPRPPPAPLPPAAELEVLRRARRGD